jgi:DNA-directed RNA polymerase specialized sigma24 family protein
LRELAATIKSDPGSRDANRLIAELIIGWRRYYEPWLVLKADRQVADAVVSNVELRLMRLLRRKQQFGAAWRSVVWHMVRKELVSEKRRLAKRAEKETAVPEVFGKHAAAAEPGEEGLEETTDSPDYDVGRLRIARAKLSPGDQEVLELLFDRDLTRHEAAAILKVEAGMLSVRRHRALKRLRQAWDEEGGKDV